MSTWLRMAIVITLVLASLVAAAMTLLVADNDRWPIRWLEVEGQLNRVTAAQVRAALAGEAGRGFFAVDMDRAQASVEALPWVARARISRSWPDTLNVEVAEHRPVARWNDDALVSQRGEAFRVAGTSGMQGLVQLSGPESQLSLMFQQWREIQRSLGRVGLEVRRLQLDARGALAVELTNGMDLLLGREQLNARLNRFMGVHAALLDSGPIKRIDLRYPNGLALTRPPTVQPTAIARQEKNRDSLPIQDIHG